MMSVTLMLLALGWASPVKAADVSVYLNPTGFTDNGARFALYLFGGEAETTWIDFAASDEEGIYVASFDSETYPQMIICRMNGETTDNNWDNRWNQSDDLTSPAANTLYTGNGYATETNNMQFTTQSPYPVTYTYTVEGVAALFGTAWAATADNVMTKGTDGKYTLTKENVMLLTGDYEYKVYRSDDVWIPADDNKKLSIAENGYYTVTFTYDPATNDPAAEATKTEAIGYVVDFNTAITTTDPDFPVASNWKHIVDSYEDYWGDESYVSYQSMLSDGYGWNGSGCFRVYTNQKSNGTYDLLVTPLVSGKVTLYVKPVGKYYNDSAFLELYSLNSDGTEKGSVLATTNFSSKSNSEEWDWTPLTITLTEEQRIGIRGSQVYMDNFLAENATIVPLTEMRVTSVMSLEGQTGTSGTNPSFSQDENGNVLVQLKVTVNNTGDVDLVAGETENYTLTLAQGTSSSSVSTYFEDAAFNVPVNIAAGQSATFEVEFNVPATVPSSGYTYFFIKENLSGTTSSSYRYAQIVAFASKFIFDKSGTSYYSSSSATTTAINFGKVTEETTVNYEIYNSGSAPLVINSFTLPEPFTSDAPEGEFTVAAGEKKQIAITMPVTTPGVFAGNLEIAYTNYGKTQATYTLGISGTVIDTSKNWITFSNDANNNGQFPAGSIHSDQVYISKAGSEDNWYLQSTSTTTKFITPLLTAAAGESFTYDAWYSSYSYDCAVKVYTSTDRINWTQVDNQTYSSGIGSTVNTFTVTIPEAGNYYIGFELIKNALIDNIYGLTLAPTPEHDWYVMDSNLPTTGTQNADYTATVSLKNISADADVIETATLYVGDEAVATVENVALEGNDKTAAVGTGRNGKANIENPVEVSVTYKPHNFGTFPAYIELKSGETVVATEVVTLTIAEEKIESDITINGNTTSTYVPIYGSWMDATGGSSTDFYYTKEQLTNSYGLKSGDVITAITFKGTASTKTINSLTGKFWVAMENVDDFTVGSPNKENMTEVTLFDHETVTFTYGETKEFVLDLSANPITYDGESIIRFFTNFDGNGSWISITFPADNNYQNAWYGYGTTPSWTQASASPVASFSLAVEPTTMAGTVTDGTNPVEGATVTLRNEANDVEYSATTAADGTYSINVIQDKLAYKAVADAEGLVAPVQNVASFDEAVNFTLAEPEYGEVWTGEAEIADVTAGYFKYLAKAGDKLVISYVEEGAETNTLKFTKPNSWDNVHVYAWDANQTNVTAAWPGDVLSDPYMNEYGEQVFTYSVPANVVGVVFNNGGDAQTVDITDLNVTGYYTDGSLTEGKLNVFPWTDPSNAAVELLDQSGNTIAEATLADGTAEVELTEALMTKLAGGLYAMVKGSAANITKVELVELQPISVTISASKYATLYYQNVNLTIPEGVTAYAAVKNGNTIELNEIADVIPAGVPVVINGEAGTYDFLIAAEADEFTGENDLTGTEEDVKDEEAGYKYYVLCWKDSSKSAVGFYFQSGSNGAYAQVKAHQAYMKINASEAPAKGFDIFINGDATGIDSIELSTLTDNDKVYTLSGVRVNANRVAKGVYIVNGQKVVIK